MKPIAGVQKQGTAGLTDAEGLVFFFFLINYFTVSKSVSVDTSTILYNHHHCLVLDRKKMSSPLSSYNSLSSSCPCQLLSCFQSLWIFLSWIFPIRGITQCGTFCVWLLPLSMFLKFIHIAAGGNTPFLFYG